MKKILCVLAVLVTVSSAGLYAQQGAGRTFDPAKMKERELQRLKQSELQLTDAQADSIVAVNIEAFQQMRDFRELPEDVRRSKIKDLDGYRLKRWSEALKNEELAKKVAEFYQKEREKRRQHTSE